MSRAIIFLVAMVFVAYGVYALVQSRTNPQLLGVVVAALSVIGGVGLALNRRWSRYLIYFVSACVVGGWLYATVSAMRVLPYRGIVESVISLLPGLFIIVIAAGGSFAVMKHFRREARS